MNLRHSGCAALAVCAIFAAVARAETTLNEEQRIAVGVQVGHPVVMSVPDRLDALGTVLDAAQLVAEEGELQAAKFAEHYAAAEVERLRGLYEGGAAASKKMLQSAESDLAKARSQWQASAALFAQRWGPLPSVSHRGHSLWLRADVLGRHSLGELPKRALLQIDGIEVPGRVLGIMRGIAEQQGIGLLIEVPDAPAGLGAGARVPVILFSGTRTGSLLPREAFLYDEHGAYVYKQTARKAGEKVTRYSPVKVTLLLAYGEGWLVTGVDSDDDIVVRGAGVLWSLQDVADHDADTDLD